MTIEFRLVSDKSIFGKQKQLDSEFAAAFFATCAQDASATNSLHSDTKSVCFFAFSAIWLICSFHKTV